MRTRTSGTPRIRRSGRAQAFGGTVVRHAPDVHVLWLDASDGSAWAAPYDGRLVARYHLLWELAHVCFEHPGLLGPPEPECDDDVCVTCSDEGVLAEVVTHHGGSTTVRSARGTETIDTALVGPVVPGDLVLVHAGTAISRVDTEPG